MTTATAERTSKPKAKPTEKRSELPQPSSTWAAKSLAALDAWYRPRRWFHAGDPLNGSTPIDNPPKGTPVDDLLVIIKLFFPEQRADSTWIRAFLESFGSAEAETLRAFGGSVPAKRIAESPLLKHVDQLAARMAGEEVKARLSDRIAEVGKTLDEEIGKRLRLGQTHPDIIPITAFNNLEVVHLETYRLHPEICAAARLDNVKTDHPALTNWPLEAQVVLEPGCTFRQPTIVLGVHDHPWGGLGLPHLWYHISSLRFWTLRVREASVDRLGESQILAELWNENRDRFEKYGIRPRKHVSLPTGVPTRDELLRHVGVPASWCERVKHVMTSLLDVTGSLPLPTEDAPLADLLAVFLALGIHPWEANSIKVGADRTAALVAGNARRAELREDMLKPLVLNTSKRVADLRDRSLLWAVQNFQASSSYRKEEDANAQ